MAWPFRDKYAARLLEGDGWINYVRLFPNNAERLRALPRWVRFYNQRRPHSELGNQPPWMVFVNKVRGNHS